jgi:hypothetical protein
MYWRNLVLSPNSCWNQSFRPSSTEDTIFRETGTRQWRRFIAFSSLGRKSGCSGFLIIFHQHNPLDLISIFGSIALHWHVVCDGLLQEQARSMNSSACQQAGSLASQRTSKVSARQVADPSAGTARLRQSAHQLDRQQPAPIWHTRAGRPSGWPARKRSTFGTKTARYRCRESHDSNLFGGKHHDQH